LQIRETVSMHVSVVTVNAGCCRPQCSAAGIQRQRQTFASAAGEEPQDEEEEEQQFAAGVCQRRT